MLTMHDPQTVLQVSNWVQVCKGKYKGDVKFVAWMENFVEILLVPRLNPPTTIDNLKRNWTVVHSKPKLMAPDTIKEVYVVNPRYGSEEAFTALRLQFQYGLVEKAYNFYSVFSTAVIPIFFFSLFLISSHPLILSSKFPKLEEWIFEERELVFIRSSGEQAIVTAVKPCHLEVCRSNRSGNMVVWWNDIHKAIQVRDFIKVMSGSLIEMAGWVNCIDEEVVNVIEKVAGATSPDTDSQGIFYSIGFIYFC